MTDNEAGKADLHALKGALETALNRIAKLEDEVAEHRQMKETVSDSVRDFKVISAQAPAVSFYSRCILQLRAGLHVLDADETRKTVLELARDVLGESPGAESELFLHHLNRMCASAGINNVVSFPDPRGSPNL